MQRFNLGKFNIKSVSANESGGYINAISSTTVAVNVSYSVNGNIEAISETNEALGVKIVPVTAHSIDAISSLSGNNRRVLIAELDESDAISSLTVQPASVFGEQFIALPDLTLRAGQTLVIDTDKMTVTVDGQNVINLMSNDSEFFLLLQGEDIVTYSDDSNSRNINIKVEWKDRWL